MNARERFLANLHFQPVDRVFRWESLGMWPETLDRWYAEGLDGRFKQPLPGDTGAIAHDEYQRVLVHAFDFDRLDYLRDAVISVIPILRFILPSNGRSSARMGIPAPSEMRMASSNASWCITAPARCRSSSNTRLKNKADFQRLLPHLDAALPGRLAPDWAELCAFYNRREFPVGLTLCGAFGHPRNLLGVEGLCLAYYEQPGLVHEILEQWVEFYIRLSSRVWEGIHFDFILIWEDMAYKNGPLISPRLVKEFMLPYYRRVIEHVRGLGCDTIIVDSDGDVKRVGAIVHAARG